MKKLNLMTFFLSLLICIGITSCGGDDDDKGSGSRLVGDLWRPADYTERIYKEYKDKLEYKKYDKTAKFSAGMDVYEFTSASGGFYHYYAACESMNMGGWGYVDQIYIKSEYISGVGTVYWFEAGNKRAFTYVKNEDALTIIEGSDVKVGNYANGKLHIGGQSFTKWSK